MGKVEDHLLKNLEMFRAFVRARVSDPELAADVVQDSLLKAIKAEDSIRDEENVVAWFYRILRRTIIDLYRRRGTGEKALQRLTAEADTALDAEAERSLCACLKEVLPTLKPEYAAAIDKVDLGGADVQEAARDLGITSNNLKVRLHRGRMQLRERLEQTCRMCSTHGCLDCTCDNPASH